MLKLVRFFRRDIPLAIDHAALLQCLPNVVQTSWTFCSDVACSLGNHALFHNAIPSSDGWISCDFTSF